MAVKRTKLEMEAVYDDVMDHMIRLRVDDRVKPTLVKKYNVHPQTVSKWMAEVRARLRASAKDSDHEDKRNLMRATLNTLLSMAINKSVVVRNPDGKPVIDTQTQKPVKVAAPDLKEALNACKQLRDLDALDMPVQVQTTINGETKTTLILGDVERTHLEKALRGLA